MKAKSKTLWEVVLPNGNRLWRTEKCLLQKSGNGRLHREYRGASSVWSDFRWALDLRPFGNVHN